MADVIIWEETQKEGKPRRTKQCTVSTRWMSGHPSTIHQILQLIDAPKSIEGVFKHYRSCERPVQNLSPFDFSPTSNLFRLPLLVLLILSLSIASSIFISTSLRWFHTSNTIIVARRRCPDLQHSKVLQWHHPWMILCVCKSLDMHASINTHRQLGMAHCMVHHVDPFTVPLAGWASLAHSSKAH